MLLLETDALRVKNVASMDGHYLKWSEIYESILMFSSSIPTTCGIVIHHSRDVEHIKINRKVWGFVFLDMVDQLHW
uniref:Uncharacterized protein n=1 Tax=Physcomitrium patens TaxID=3218 RepID=A0A2K1K855_PHYPA|nr:hypothetical protein PHYPA_011846 [Physcomitrium patens]